MVNDFTPLTVTLNYMSNNRSRIIEAYDEDDSLCDTVARLFQADGNYIETGRMGNVDVEQKLFNCDMSNYCSSSDGVCRFYVSDKEELIEAMDTELIDTKLNKLGL